MTDWNRSPTEPQRVTQSETNHYLELLTSKTGQNGGAPSLPTDVLVGQFGIGQFNGAFGPNSQPIQQQTTNVEKCHHRYYHPSDAKGDSARTAGELSATTIATPSTIAASAAASTANDTTVTAARLTDAGHLQSTWAAGP